MPIRRGLILLTIFLLALCAVKAVHASPQSSAQSKGKASISGVVIGPDDKPVPHASITYQSSGGSAPHAVHADAHGKFLITGLRTDNYDLRATSHGIFSEWEKNVSVRKGHSKSVTLTLIYAKEMPKSASATVAAKPQH
jgi:Carboxypeptidase regulatory-like domain